MRDFLLEFATKQRLFFGDRSVSRRSTLAETHAATRGSEQNGRHDFSAVSLLPSTVPLIFSDSIGYLRTFPGDSGRQRNQFYSARQVAARFSGIVIEFNDLITSARCLVTTVLSRDTFYTWTSAGKKENRICLFRASSRGSWIEILNKQVLILYTRSRISKRRARVIRQANICRHFVKKWNFEGTIFLISVCSKKSLAWLLLID